MPLARLYDFSPGTTIRSAEMDAEFNQLVALIDGTDAVNPLYIGGVSPNGTPKFFVLGQSEFQSLTSGRVIGIWKSLGEANPRLDLRNTGEIISVASQHNVTPSTQRMELMGTLYASSLNIGNVGAGEDTLHTFTVGAQVFSNSKDYAKVRAAGFTAANANNKQLKFKITTTSGTTVILATGVIVENNKPWFFEADIMPDQDSVSTVTIVARFWCGATEVRTYQLLTGYDFTVDNTWFFTGEAVADNDLVQGLTIIEKGFSLN